MALAEIAVEEVAQNLEEAAEVTRKINAAGVGYFGVGLAVGVAVGFYIGQRRNREKFREEAFAETQEEVRAIRETFARKAMVMEDKPKAEEIVQERGYEVLSDERPLPAPVPVRSYHAVTRNDIETASPIPVPWDYEAELKTRGPQEPYVIHQEEWRSDPENAKVAYTYFAADDTLMDEDQQQIEDPASLVGNTLSLRWGHGSGDPDTVFIRNPAVGLDIEISRSKGSYEEEVLGIDGIHDGPPDDAP